LDAKKQEGVIREATAKLTNDAEVHSELGKKRQAG
jgi:hypothetical protein